MRGVVVGTGKRFDEVGQRLVTLLTRLLTSRDLQENKAWLEEAQRVAHVGYWVWDLETNHLVWSDETYRIFGLRQHDGLIDLDKLREMIHPDDREAVFRTAEEAIRSGARADCEHRLFRPSGEMRVVHSLGDLKKDSSGRPYQMFGTTQDITDRKRTEEALQRTQFYLSEGQRLAHMGSWAFNESGHYWSDELYKIYGLDPQNGAPTVDQYLSLVHPQDRASMAETIKIMQEQHCGHDLIERIVRPDGQLRYVRAVAVPVVEKGVFKGFVGTTMDVTEHELLTRELRREQAYLAEAQSLAHIGSWATNFDTGQIFHISDETVRIHGFDPHQGPIPYERFYATVHPADEPVVRATLQNAIRTRTDYDIREFRICRPDGSIRFLRTIGHHNRSGEIGEYVGITMDITERKRAEQELQQLVDFVPQVIVVFDSDGNVIHANRVAREYTGLTLEEFRSLDVFLRAIHPDDVERVRAAHKQGFAGSKPFEHDSRLLGKDGIHRWFLGRYNPWVEEGRVKRWYVTATEIESRKREEERVRQENVRLEERTRIARELHDTLLQTVQSASMMLSVAVDDTASDSLVKPQLDRILQIMRLGIDEGRSAIQGLRSSGTQTSDLLASLSHIQDELEVQPDIDFRVMVTGRQRQLPREILDETYRIGREALVNAFCHSGAKRIELELEYSDTELRIRIRDNGCGINPQVLHAGREGHWGLAGMRERAAKIGGLVTILSTRTAGTEVQLSIPINVVSALLTSD